MTQVLLTVILTIAEAPRGMVPLSMAMTSNCKLVYLRYTSSQSSKLSLKSTGGLKEDKGFLTFFFNIKLFKCSRCASYYSENSSIKMPERISQ